MPITPKRAGSRAPEGSRYASEVLADNIHGHRSLRRMSQQALADQMKALGHGWWRATVSEVERAGRTVTTDELLALALALDTTIADLLDPTGPDGRGTDGVYIGDIAYPDGASFLPSRIGQLLARSVAPVHFDGTAVKVPVTPETLPYIGKRKDQ